MKLTERLELIERLVLDRATPSQICGHLHAIREELDAYEQEAGQFAELQRENQRLNAENAELKKPKSRMVRVRRV